MANISTKFADDFVLSFVDAFGEPPHYVCLAPGRVNIIGEHIDYMGYSVLPAAIAKHVYSALRLEKCPEKGKPFLSLHNTNSICYANRVFEKPEDLIVENQPTWQNYVVAACIGVAEFAISGDVAQVGEYYTKCKRQLWIEQFSAKMPLSISVLISGALPPAAGLSSSSALIVSVTMLILEACELRLSRKIIAEICAKSERHVGIAGGGMDQAAICLSKSHCAQLISFDPLQYQIVRIPGKVDFYLANSGVDSAKAVTAAKYYNKRVFECRLAAFILCKFLHVDISKFTDGTAKNKLTLRMVQEALSGTLEDCLMHTRAYIPPKPLTHDECTDILGGSIIQYLLEDHGASRVWTENECFNPYDRAIHVYSEANRVEKFVSICEEEKYSEDDKLKKLGDLMNESHRSCDQLYDCSCEELNQITNVARKNGALGSRLTGAGWGGFTISMVLKDNTSFALKMTEYFNSKRKKDDAQKNDFFDVELSSGATLFSITYVNKDNIVWKSIHLEDS